MKIAWLYRDDDEWKISFTEPESWYSDVKMIVYQEVEPGIPS